MNFFPSTSFLLLIIIMVIDLPLSLSANDQYTSCSQLFNCRDIKNITFPFWGNDRPEYCGHPDFGLKCRNDTVEIEIQSHSYTVLNISKANQSLRIATTDSWNDNCPTRFTNISLPSNVFNYSNPFNQNLSLFYACPAIPELVMVKKFACSVNGTDENYYWVDSIPGRPSQLSSCNVSVKVTVPERIVNQDFRGSQLNMEDVLKEGFDVGYAVNDSFCNYCEVSGGACGYNWTSAQPICFCFGGQGGETCYGRPISQINPVSVIGLILGIGAVLGAVIIISLCCWKKHSITNAIIFLKREKKAHRAVKEFLENYRSLAPKRYTYSDIKKITSSFKDKIGQGGYGGVYKGKLLDGRLVAVKLLDKAKGDGEEFINEVASISRTSHVNIVSLLGFCFDGSKRALIYEFMVNGSLEKFIYGHSTLLAASQLGWEKLYEIAVGVARGLEYLHRGCNTRILHLDIKPHNILLDQDYTPKISDFGLAKLCPKKESIISMLGTRGTIGYIAPEMVSRVFGGVSNKSDVYSYGMLVLEIVGKRKNMDVGADHTSEIYFPEWIYKHLDNDLQLLGLSSIVEEEISKKMIVVALWCIQTNPTDRPTMSKVVEMLEARQETLQIPPKPNLGSPPRSPIHSPST